MGCIVYSLQKIKKKLTGRPLDKHPQRKIFKRSAVAICLRESMGQVELLMIKRAERVGDTWSGHMAFPGGRMDAADANSYATAMRECFEELGADIEPHCEYIHRLHDVQATGGGAQLPLIVSPYIFHMTYTPDFNPNYEVADVVWIPLEFFRQTGNRQYMEIAHAGLDYALPCFIYRGYTVWGMSLRMIEELLAQLSKP